MVSKIEVRYSVVVDFILSISRVVHNDSLSSFINEYDQDLAEKIKLNEEIIKWIKTVTDNSDDEMTDLMDFFGNKETVFRLVFLHLNSEHKFPTINDFIDFIIDIDAKDLIDKYFEILFDYYEIELDGKKMEELDSNSFMSIIDETEFKANRKWELLQCYNAPEKIKENVIYLFTWYYETHFKQIENKIEKIGKRHVKIIKQKLANYGSEYLLLLTRNDYSKDKMSKKNIVLSISYFLEIIHLFQERKDIAQDTYFLGYRHNELFVERKHRVMSNVHLFKALADETRQNMIRLLSQRDYYADEFAKEFNLANSTISYHLSILILEGIISTTKFANKTYLSLRKDYLKTTIEKAMEKMLTHNDEKELSDEK